MQDDLIDLRSPGPAGGPQGRVAAHPIDSQSAEDDQEFSFQRPVVPVLKLPFALGLQRPVVPSLIDDILPSKDQPTNTGNTEPPCSSSNVPTAQLINLLTPRSEAIDSKDQEPQGSPLELDFPPPADKQNASEPQASSSNQQQPSSTGAPVPSGDLGEGSGFVTSSSSPSLREQQLEKELAETKLKLSKVEASREAAARDLGQHKAIISKLEGSITSYEKQMKQAADEVANLRVKVAAAERAAADASMAAGVTPERCRVSAKALMEETHRAEEARQRKEAELHQTQQLLHYEVQEMRGLKDFMNQERLTLLSEKESLSSQLQESKATASTALSRCQELAAQLEACEDQLREAKREVWTLNNTSIETNAEIAAVRAQAAQAQAALSSAEEQAVEDQEARQKAESDLREGLAAGVKLYKQIRAVSHVLEGHMHVFQPIPKVALSIRSLQDWCAKQAGFWGAHAAAAAEADLGSGALIGASAGDGEATMNLTQMMALARQQNSTGAVCPPTVSKR